MSKTSKRNNKSHTTLSGSQEFETESECPHPLNLFITLKGESPGPGDCSLLVLFNDKILNEEKWQDDLVIDTIALQLNLNEETHQEYVADKPLIFLLRGITGKTSKDQDPFLNIDNRAGGNIDLYPLALGEKFIGVTVALVLINSGFPSGCFVQVYAHYKGIIEKNRIPLMLTMISAHCLPTIKEGTVFLGGIGLDGIHDSISIKFGMSLSTSTARKVGWGTASNAGHAAKTDFNLPDEDKFVPNNVSIFNTNSCNSVYWNVMRRVLVDPTLLQTRLNRTFFLELAGVPKSGKIELRGRYIACVDAGVLLQPGQSGVTVCAKLLYLNNDLPECVGTILDLPPSSARGINTRENDAVTDEQGNNSYIIIRLDLMDSLVPKAKITSLFDLIGFSPSGEKVPDDALKIISPQEEAPLDKRRISKEGGALLVHKELSNLAYKCTLQMNKSIKRTAANRLLMRVRSMLKQFPPTNSSLIDYQDTITSQHSATRRAVTCSFAPQIPKPRPSLGIAAARCRAAGDTRISTQHIETNLKNNPNHPRVLLSKVLRCLEERNDTEAYKYLLVALKVHPRNRYLLWIYGGLQFNKGPQAIQTAAAAFRIAVKGDRSDGTTSAIGWAALHALHHFDGNEYAAFVAAKKMRKSFELPRKWRQYLKRWVDSSGEEETLWTPGVIDSQNPLLITAAFFLCLRCFKLSERILQCLDQGCNVRGTCSILKEKPEPGVYYVKVASLLLRRQLDEALEEAERGIKHFGPIAILSQIRATCLAFAKGWDGNCESALLEADVAGAEPCPALLLRAALGGLKTNVNTSLQRAARAHKIAPSAYSALTIGRIYAKMGEEKFAERWAAAAVKSEPSLSDGWTFLAILSMYKKDFDKARALLQTAKQTGPTSPEIAADLDRLMKVVNVKKLPDVMITDLCLCDYY